MHTILSHFDFDIYFWPHLCFSRYITAIFPQMCLMLDQFLWGHSSRVCDISCLHIGTVIIVHFHGTQDIKWSVTTVTILEKSS